MTNNEQLAKLYEIAAGIESTFREEGRYMSESRSFVLGEELSYLNEEIEQLKVKGNKQ